MPRRPHRHFLYELYLALSESNSTHNLGLTEPMARKRIREFLPSFAGVLDTVIDASGDLTKIDPAILDRTDAVLIAEDKSLDPAEIMNSRIRDGSGRFAKPEETAKPVNQESRMDTLLDRLAAQLEPEAPKPAAQPEAPKPQPKDMNAILRQLANP